MANEFVARNGIIAQNNSTVTGSFLVSGSTTQIGNNTLAGNTTLSGSIIISGSTTTPATPTIKIYGDAETNGVIKFIPVVKNIDTSISASYIFVSGSTNDLHFSQNGNGFNNVTRLRWLESNLYTGLLNGGLITSQSSTVYQISSGSGIIVNLNASLTGNPYPTVEYVNWSNLSASIAPTSASYDQTFIGVQSGGTIYAQGTPFVAGQFDTLIPIGVVLHQNHSTINGVKTQPSLAYGFKQRSNIFTRAFGPLKLSGFTVAPSGSSTGSLVIGSGTAYQDGANYPIDPNNPSYVTDAGTSVSKIFRYYQSGSQWVYNTNNGAGYPTIDPVNYSNNGTLNTVGNSNYSIQRVYWYPNSTTKAIVVYYGNAIYGTLADAVSNLNIESFSEAPNTAANAIYLGAYAIKGGTNTTLQNTNHFTWLAGGLFRGVSGAGGGGSTVTTTLFGLSDVSLSGPLDHQPLAYDTTAGKWTNQSNISASISGNALTSTTASYAQTALSASYTTTSSFATTAISASYFSGSVSNAVTATTASYALTASYVSGSSSVSASYAATSSYANNFTVAGTLTAQTIVAQTITSSISYLTGSTRHGSLLTDTHQFTGSVLMTGSLAVNGDITGSSVTVSGGTTGSITSPAAGTLTIMAGQPSTQLNFGGNTSLFPALIRNAATINFRNASNSGYISFTALAANFTGNADSNISNAGGYAQTGTNINTLTGPLSASNATFSGSVTSTNGFTGSLFGTATTASYVIQAQSASYWSGSVLNATTASYALTASYVSGSSSVSASYAATSSYADNFTVGNTLTAQRIVVQTISSSIEYASGSNRFGNDITNTQTFTGSVGITGSLTVNADASVNKISVGGGAINQYGVLDINGLSSTGANKGITFSSGGTAVALFGVPGTNSQYANGSVANTDFVLRTIPTSGRLLYAIGASGNTAMAIVPTGNVLIGTLTDNGYRLQIQGSGSASGSLYVNGLSTFDGVISGSYTSNNPSSSLIVLSGSIQPSASLGGTSAMYVNTVLSASANSQTLVGLDINPTFANSSFTGVNNFGLRVNNNTGIQAAIVTGYNSLRLTTIGLSSNIGFSLNQTTLEVGRFASTTGNFILQNGGTYNDNGYRLQVSGSTSGSLYTDGLVVHTGTLSGSYTTNNPSSSLVLLSGNITPSASLGGASIIYANTVLSASANSQTLVGLDINPTFTVGSFTGVNQYGLRIIPRQSYQIVLGGINQAGIIAFARGSDGSLQGSIGYSSTNSGGDFNISSGGGGGIIGFTTGITRGAQLFNTGNFTLQNGGTFTDAGYRLDVSGSTRLNGPTTIVSASLNYQENLAVATGSFQTIVSAATGSYRAAFFDYVTYSGSIVRAGTLVSTWSGSNTEYFENYTGDLGGSTAVVTLQTAISGSNIQLQAGISGSAWSVRSLVRLL